MVVIFPVREYLSMSLVPTAQVSSWYTVCQWRPGSSFQSEGILSAFPVGQALHQTPQLCLSGNGFIYPLCLDDSFVSFCILVYVVCVFCMRIYLCMLCVLYVACVCFMCMCVACICCVWVVYVCLCVLHVCVVYFVSRNFAHSKVMILSHFCLEFLVLTFIFMSLIHVELLFCVWQKVKGLWVMKTNFIFVKMFSFCLFVCF